MVVPASMASIVLPGFLSRASISWVSLAVARLVIPDGPPDRAFKMSARLLMLLEAGGRIFPPTVGVCLRESGAIDASSYGNKYSCTFSSKNETF